MLKSRQLESGLTEVRVALKRIDVRNSHPLRDELQLAVDHSDRLVLNLDDVEFIDSSGIAVVVWLIKLRPSPRTWLSISGVRPDVANVFRLCRLDTLIDIGPTTNEASRAMA